MEKGKRQESKKPGRLEKFLENQSADVKNWAPDEVITKLSQPESDIPKSRFVNPF